MGGVSTGETKEVDVVAGDSSETTKDHAPFSRHGAGEMDSRNVLWNFHGAEPLTRLSTCIPSITLSPRE